MNCPTPFFLKSNRASGVEKSGEFVNKEGETLPLFAKTKWIEHNGVHYQEVPCGSCGACRYNRRVDWTIRITKEARYHTSAVFLTLTYSDENVPWSTSSGLQTLCKKDFQDFMKRYRKSIEPRKIRFYSIGEYGPETCRPHYHAILFGSYLSETDAIYKAWGHGHITLYPVNPARVHYITKYHVNANPKLSEELGIEPEFTLMSRRPGIGAQYLDKAVHGVHNKYLEINGFKMRMPRYYAEKIYSKFDQGFMALKSRQQAENKRLNEIKRLDKLHQGQGAYELSQREYNASLKVTAKNPFDTSRI